MQYEKIKNENNKIDRWMRLLHCFMLMKEKISHFRYRYDIDQSQNENKNYTIDHADSSQNRVLESSILPASEILSQKEYLFIGVVSLAH
jgi:hypothetical protein